MVVDAFVAYQLIKILSTPFEETDAYKLGIIDKNGKNLIPRSKLKNSEQKSAYTIFNVIGFNLKKILNKVPGLKTRIGSFATALFLLKEHQNLDEKSFRYLEKSVENWLLNQDIEIEKNLNEAAVFIEGVYKYKGRKIYVPRTESVTSVLGVPIFKVKVGDEKLIVSANELEEDIANVAGSGQVAGLKFPPPVSSRGMMARRKGMSGPNAPVGLEGY